MIKAFCNIISAIFHPLLWPVYATVLFLYYIPLWEMSILNQEAKRALILIVGIFTFVLPSAIIILLKTQNVISSVRLEKRNERTWPYIVALFFYSSLLALFNFLSLPPLFMKLLIISTLSIALTLTINFRIKISAHMVSAAAVIGTIYALNLYQFAFLPGILVTLLYILGLIAAARLYLNAHSPKEVLLGALIGFMVPLFIL